MTDQSLAWLPRKQKRLKDWREFAADQIQDEDLKSATEKELMRYEELLNSVWESRSVDAEMLKKIEDLERELEQRNEEARMRVVGRRRANQ